MCEISGVTEIKNNKIISCTPYDGSFIGSKTLKIYDSNNNLFTTTEFALDRTRPCFNDKACAPWIMLTANVSENFLQKGNRIELL